MSTVGPIVRPIQASLNLIETLTRVILLNFDTGTIFDNYRGRELLFSAGIPDEVIEMINRHRVNNGQDTQCWILVAR